jgi:dolichol-phosphate mannosyltransferase
VSDIPALERTARQDRPRVSVVIPARDEAAYIRRCIASVRRVLLASRVRAEIIVVDDGSTDGTAEAVAHCPASWEVRLLRREVPGGKGAAVLLGFTHAQGDLVAFIDADLELPPEKLLAMIRRAGQGPGETCVVASRTRDSRRPLERMSSHLARRLIAAVLRLGVSDTQAGLKLFPGWFARDVLPQAVQERGWLFDIEMLLLAREHRLELAEVPVQVHAVRPRSAKAGTMLRALPALMRYAARRWRHAPPRALSRREFMRTLRFLAVGLTNTMIDLLAFIGLLALRPPGRDPFLAALYAVAAWAMASASGYLLHSRVTFRAKLPVAGFYLVTGSAVGLQALCTVIGTSAGFPHGPLLGKAFGMVLSGLVSYLGYRELAQRRWVHRRRMPKVSASPSEEW